MSNVIAIAMMGAMSLFMWNTGVLASTRRMAAVPFMVCMCEILTFNLLDMARFPLFGIVLWSARLCILLCCALKLRQDRMVARRRARRRRLEEKCFQSQRDGHNAAIISLPRCA